MPTAPYVLAAVAVAAYRFLLGADGGVDYDTTALAPEVDQDSGEPVPRTPWALRVRPDVLFAVFNSRQYFYTSLHGSFVQPLLDTYEGSGEVLAAARLRVGRGLAIHPGVFLRAASSNELLRGQTDSVAIGTSELFYSISGGGWLELDYPFTRRFRMLGRVEAQAWILDLIPPELRDVQPSLNIVGQLTALVAVTRTDGVAGELQVVEGLFRPEGEDTQHQVTLTGRAIYRRFWTPYLMTDIALGMIGLREMDGQWSPNVTANAMVIMAGRPRWLVLDLSYERRFEYVSLTSPGAMQDSAQALAAFGPFNGFQLSVALLWTRSELEVRSTQPPHVRSVRPFHTVGGSVEARYLREIGELGFGPFLEAYVFTPFAEERPYDTSYEFLPPGYDTVEAVLLLGFRLQYNLQTGRGRRESADGGALGGSRSRAERRLSMQRMSREERAVPVFARGMRSMTASEADEDALFQQHDPFGRVQGEYEDDEEEELASPRPSWEDEPEEDREPDEDEDGDHEDDEAGWGWDRDEEQEEGAEP